MFLNGHMRGSILQKKKPIGTAQKYLELNKICREVANNKNMYVDIFVLETSWLELKAPLIVSLNLKYISRVSFSE